MSAQRRHNYLELMTGLFSVELNSSTSSVSNQCDDTEGRNIVKSGFVHIFLDDRPQWNAVQMIQEEGSYPWTGGQLSQEGEEQARQAVKTEQVAILGYSVYVGNRNMQLLVCDEKKDTHCGITPM